MVVSSEIHFGLSRMFATFREINCGQTTMVFREMWQASAWLGLPQNYDPSGLGEPTRIS